MADIEHPGERRSIANSLMIALGIVAGVAGATGMLARDKNFPIALDGGVRSAYLPLTEPFDRMIGAKLAIAYEAENLGVGIAALNAKASRATFVTQSKGTASAELVGVYYSHLMPWTKSAISLVETGSDNKSPAAVRYFVNATRILHKARIAMEQSGKPDFTWVGHADRSVGKTLADRNADAVLVAIQRQAEPFRPLGNNFLAYTDYKRIPDEELTRRVDVAAKLDFFRRAGIDVKADTAARLTAAPALNTDFETYFEGMHQFSGAGAKDLESGTAHSPDIKPDLLQHYATMNDALQAARSHATAILSGSLAPTPIHDLKAALPAGTFVVAAPGYSR